MANIKITELDAATTLASTDVLVAVDVSEDVTKKTTVTDLFRTLPDGTAAAPALAFADDNNTGILSPAENQLAFATGGTQRVTIDGSGNVTISGGLTVEGQTTTVESTIVTIDDKNIELGSVASPSDTTADGGGITLKGATDKTLKWINSTGCWTFNQPMNFNDHVRIGSSGNVGIGDSSPGHKLVVKDAGATNTSNYLNVISGNAANAGIAFGDTDTDLQAGIVYLNSDNALRFFKSGFTEAARIDSSGRLLIGTTTPGAFTNRRVSIATSSGTTALELRSATNGDSRIIFTDSTDSSNSGSYKGQILYDQTSDYMSFNTNGNNERLRITSAGLVNVTGGVQVTENVTPTSGSGVEIFKASAFSGQIQAYNRDSSAWMDLKLKGNNLQFFANGSERLRVDTNGRVGIGTTSPFRSVHVSGSSDQYVRITSTNSANAGIEFGDSDDPGRANVIYSNSADSMLFTVNGSERLRIDSSGKVGIGETSVQSTLHVAKNIADSAAISWANSQLSVATPIAGNSTANRATIYFAPYGSDNNYAPSAISATAGTSGASTLKFFTNASGNLTGQVQSYERMRIDSSGHVMIGSTTDFANINCDDLQVGDTGNANTGITLGSSSQAQIAFADSGDARAGVIHYQHTDNSLRFMTNGAANERMRIDNSGRLLLGTTSVYSPSGGGQVPVTVVDSGDHRTALVVSNQTNGSSAGSAVVLAAHGVDWQLEATSLSKDSKAFTIKSGTDERFRIDSSGRVGIGNSSPSQPLDVTGWVKTSVGLLGTYGRVGLGDSGGPEITTGALANPIKFIGGNGSTNLERMRIDGSGRLLLGTTTEGDSTADNLTIADSGNCGMTVRSGTSSSGSIFFSDATSGSGEYDGYVQYQHDNRALRFATAATERFRITSTGAWAIEGASNYGTSGQVLTSNGNDSPTWQSPSAGAQIIAGNTNVECVDTGSNGHILFDTEGSERMRITSGGLVGINATNPGNTLHVVDPGGNVAGSIDVGPAANKARIFADSNGIRFGSVSNHSVIFRVNNNEKVRIDTSGRVGINTSSPNFTLDVNGEVAITEGQALTWHDGSGGRSAQIYGGSGDVLVFRNTSSNTERMRIDNSGRLLVGTTTARSVAGITSQIQLEGTGAPSSSMSLIRNTNNTANPYLFFGKTRGSADGSNTAVQNGDYLGAIYFAGADGTDLNNYAAAIYANVDGTPGSNDLPGRLTFETTSDGSGSSTERMRIDSSGRLMLGTTSVGNSAADDLTVATSGSTGITIRSGTSSNGNLFFADSASGTAAHDGFIQYQHANRALKFGAAATEQMRIDSSGRVMIGTTSNNGGFLTVDSGGTQNIAIRDNGIENHKYNGNAEIAINYVGYNGGTGQFRDFRIYNGKAAHLATFDGSAGRFGVGASATSPGGRIHIHNGSSNEFALRIDHDHSTAIFQFVEVGSSSYAGDGLKMHYTRGGNSAFNFMACDANHGGSADREFTFRGDGHAYADGNWNSGGADYAEFFESSTGAAIPVGTTVVLDNNKVRAATAEDAASAIMGVVRPKEPGNTTASVGNTAWNRWNQKYLTDDFDRYILDEHVVYEWTEEVEDGDDVDHSYESHQIPDGITVPDDVVAQTHDSKGNRFVHYRLNPDYDPSATYVPREDRDEWVIVGLVGQVKMLGGQPVNDRWVKMRDVSDTVEEWFIR